MVLSICDGVGVLNHYHNIMIIYKQKDKTHFDNIIIIRQRYMGHSTRIVFLVSTSYLVHFETL